MSNNYDAPNTPIASSKRKSHSKDSKTPKKSSPKQLLNSNDSSERVRTGADSRSDVKQALLFSPATYRDSDDPKQQQRKMDDTEQEINKVEGSKTAVDKNNGNVEEEDEDQFNPYQFIAGLPPHEHVCVIGKICLPPSLKPSNRPTLALDLDETLVHCTVEPVDKYDISFPVTFNGTYYQVYVRKRPFLDYFLETVSKSFEVVVFTASQKVYADVLLDLLDPGKKYISHRLFREACLLVQGNYLKDLDVLGRDLSKTVLVDNSPHAYGFQIDNGIPIESWFDDDGDTELLKLVSFLRIVQGVDDVRPVVHEHFKTYQLVQNARVS